MMFMCSRQSEDDSEIEDCSEAIWKESELPPELRGQSLLPPPPLLSYSTTLLLWGNLIQLRWLILWKLTFLFLWPAQKTASWTLRLCVRRWEWECGRVGV